MSSALPLTRYLLGLALTWGAAVAAEPVPRLVKDINRANSNAGIYAGGMTTLQDGRVVFSSLDESHGRELWITDGSARGTTMVKDINPGATDSNPYSFTEMGGKFYFAADDGVHGLEIWGSDGTANGTQRVTDIILKDEPVPVAASASRLWFTGKGAGYGWSNRPTLWASDGSSAGTLELNPLIWPPGDGVPSRDFDGVSDFTMFGETLLFATNGNQLWKSDGTLAGTVMLVDFSDDPSVRIESLAVAGNRCFAVLRKGDISSLWSGEGLSGAFSQVALSAEPEALRYISDTVAMGAAVYFTTYGTEEEHWLWRSDGTVAGTFPLVSLPHGWREQVVSDGGLFFTPASPITGAWSGTELWKTDGTVAGTRRVKEVRPGGYAEISGLTSAGNRVFFGGNDGVHGNELWTSDGTARGTRMVADLGRDTVGGGPNGFAAAGGRLYFTRIGDPDRGLWTSDGTAKGTAPILPALRVNQSSIGDFGKGYSVASGKRIFFDAFDGRHGFELWVSGGTGQSTKMVRDIIRGSRSSEPRFLTALRQGVVFVVTDDEDHSDVWFSDGSRRGTQRLTDIAFADEGFSSSFVKAGELCYFTMGIGTKARLWQTDGTSRGTFPVAAAANLYMQAWWDSESVAVVGGKLFLAGSEQANFNYEPWCLENGILSRPKDVRSGNSGSNPAWLTPVGSRLAFVTWDTSVPGREVWTSDGTAGGTLRLAGGFTHVAASIALGDKHLFLAQNEEHGVEWWTSDGTLQGTMLLKDIVLGPGEPARPSTPQSMAVMDGAFYFVAEDEEHGLELWKTDGTPAGTAIFTDLIPGPAGSGPHGLAVVEGRLYFSAFDGIHGRDLWSTDGTAAGTRRHPIALPGYTDANPVMLLPCDGRLFFGALAPGKGTELHLLDLRKGGLFRP